MGRLDGKVAFITGSAKGIGEGCARVFAAEGAGVIIADIDEANGQRVEAAIRESGGTALYHYTDVTESASIKESIGTTIERFGHLDILFNNAGTHIPKGAEALSVEEWDFLLTLNLKSAFLTTKFALPALKASRGTIINMSSLVGLVGQANSVAYCASKGGLIAMTKALALDHAADGIRVNCILPAGVKTPLLQQWIDQQPDPGHTQRDVDRWHALGWTASPEEIGRAALFLASTDASFVTGVALPVDGGTSLGY
ncbi:MAG TPA: SDR family NAD(P)-dependent oxidoreductase [Chloroflexota bacterium]|nr:SDR family NAD(P)-dependent oxidoreductase [Chloroflexota bacterium]